MVSFPKIPANFCHSYFQSFKVFKKTAWCKLQTNGFKGKLFYIPVCLFNSCSSAVSAFHVNAKHLLFVNVSVSNLSLGQGSWLSAETRLVYVVDNVVMDVSEAGREDVTWLWRLTFRGGEKKVMEFSEINDCS